MIELTSLRVESPPRPVGNRNSPSNDDGADVVHPRTGGILVGDPETACSRDCLESTEVLMHILTISESVLQSESNRLCSHKTRSRVDNDRLEKLVTAVDIASMGSLEVIVDRHEVLEHLYIEVMLVDVPIRRQQPVVDRIRMERVARGRTAGLELLPFIHKNISSKGDFSTPIRSIFVSALERGHEILQSTQTSGQMSGVFERKMVEVRFIGRMETGNSSNFLMEVVVPDLPRASLVDRCQLDHVDWGSWCNGIVAVRTSRLSQSMVFLELDHEVLCSNWGAPVPLVPESSGTS